MADSKLSTAKAVLLSVHSAVRSDIRTVRLLTAKYPRALRLDILLRILLSHLPESLEASSYVPFLEDVISGDIEDHLELRVDTSAVANLGDEEASKKVRNLGLLQLAWPDAPADAPTDPLILFLIHRSIRIDQVTGLISQIPPLLTPFLNHSPYLRSWFISTILPLTRFSYEYHPNNTQICTIEEFEKLDDRSAIRLLLSQTGKQTTQSRSDQSVGRDIRGLAGPWLYRGSKGERRKLWQASTTSSLQGIPSIDDESSNNHIQQGWQEVYDWLANCASWETAVDAIEQWAGPSDVDLGDYEDQSSWIDEGEQQGLEMLYARAALAAAYSISANSLEALVGVHRILTRLNTLLDISDQVPSVQDTTTILSPVSETEHIHRPGNAFYLRNDLLGNENILTSPNMSSLCFLQALCTSAFILAQAGFPISIREAGELALLQEEREQKILFRQLMISIGHGPKKDDVYWMNKRRQVLWLRDWRLGDEDNNGLGKGVLGKLSKEALEVEVLMHLLNNTRYGLAQSIYEASSDGPLPQDVLRSTVISAALSAYDNASNASRSRGGVKKCDDILKAFTKTLSSSPVKEQLNYLVSVTDQIGQYRLVFKQGEPFTPVYLRVHQDPLSILGKILDQNPRSYTKLTEFVGIGVDMVKADLIPRDRSTEVTLTPETRTKLCSMAEKRVVSMCIDAALAEDDFETAYSYVVSRMSNTTSQADTSSEAPGLELDDYSWRAALQAGKYRTNAQTVIPTHFGSDSSNLKIRHLEHRMQCLGHALRLAPKFTLQEILNVYRRCEEELETQIKSEEEQEVEWDRRADEEVSTMPGGFSSSGTRIELNGRSGLRAGEEAPISLFDLSKASINRAQSGFSALAMLRGKSGRNESAAIDTSGQVHGERGGSRPASMEMLSTSPDSGVGQEKERVRKRDQLKDAAVGTLASSIGWLINAPPPQQTSND